MQKIKVLIAENNSKMTKQIADSISEEKEIEIVGIAVNGKEAVENTIKLKPDVLLLNMILPYIDGLGVLEEISNMQSKPKVICGCTLQNEYMVRSAFSLGASYYTSLPINTEYLIRRIKEIGIGTKSVGVNDLCYAQNSAAPASMSLDEKITSIFLIIGIPAHIKGYPYLREAVKMAIDDIGIVNRITKELYPGIAVKFDTTASKVERAIRHAIDVAWNRGRIQNMNEIFGINIYKANDRPTNGEFIALIADRLRMKTSA